MNQQAYYLVRACFRLYLRLVYRLQVKGLEHIPSQGGIFLASNHGSFLDPPLVGVSILKRQLYFMARASLFNNFLFGWLIRSMHALPIERGKGPDQNWDSFIQVLNEGKALLVFPEGTRTENGELQRGKSGFGRLVYMCKKPVYPVYIQGSFEAYPKHGKPRRVPITVVFGPEVPLADLWNQPGEKRILRAISECTMQAIARLKESLETSGRP